MKLLNKFPMVLNHRSQHWEPVADMRYSPRMCDLELRRWFALPTSGPIYVTISTKKPTSKILQDAYYQLRTGLNNLDVELRAPGRGRECEWEEIPTLLSLDNFLENLGLVSCRTYFVWFEQD